jgi:hypothetical protein
MRLRGLFALFLLLGLACGPTHRQSSRIEAKLDQANIKLDQLLEGQEELLESARRQGSGEITLFFPWEMAILMPEQQQRLVAFLDRLAFEARGRPLLLVSVGVAPDWGGKSWQKTLSEQRANAVRPWVARLLVNTPHRWLSHYGVGDGGVEKAAGFWRQVRLIAVYDEAFLPELLPEGGH